VLKFDDEPTILIDPLRVKIMLPRTLVDRRSKSLDIPRVRPVKSMTSATPSATPTTLIAERSGRWRIFEATRLSKTFIPDSRTEKFNTSADERLASYFSGSALRF
jgi:hypothetical protein